MGILLVQPAQAATFVSSTSTPCRVSPEAGSQQVRVIPAGRKLSVLATRGDWVRVKDGTTCWVHEAAASSLASRRSPASANMESTKGQTHAARNATRSSGSYIAHGRRARSTHHSRTSESGCSCGARHVCIGPRGGRYCITSGGNKRYGV